jgi:branched-subunit amino acid aminotransferase/4-amino-4-deoxychorismate lyase
MSIYVNYNGQLLKEDAICISPNNRSFRFGDGCFETMRLFNGKIPLGSLHFDRLFASLELLKFRLPASFNRNALSKQIIELSGKNGHHSSARIRCTFFRGDGALYDVENLHVNYIIQSFSLNSANTLNENGLVADFYKDAVKCCDSFSHIKSNNFLPYVMAAIWTKENGLDDSLLLNQYGKVADATIANVFIVSNGQVQTPPFTDGGVNGVMRQYLVNCLMKDGMPFAETSLSPEDVLQASEVFLTNAVQGIRWVKQIGKSRYDCSIAAMLHEKYIKPLFL